MSKSGSGRATPEMRGSSESLTLNIPTAQSQEQTAMSEQRVLRSKSTAELPTNLLLIVQSQVKIIEAIQQLARYDNATLDEIEVNLEDLEQAHNNFDRDHQVCINSWPPSLIDHIYFKEGINEQEKRAYRATKLALRQARRALIGDSSSAPLNAEAQPRRKLPELTLPTFNGEYTSWTRFKQSFTNVIINDSSISDIDKLNYLSGQLTKEPAQIVNGYPLEESSFRSAWNALIDRYENKRFLITEQLQKVCSIKALQTATSAGLQALITKSTEAMQALASLGVTENLGAVMMTHHLISRMDKTTHMAWEMSISESKEYPTLRQLHTFLSGKARALENIENRPRERSSTAHHSSQLAAPSAARSTQSSSSQPKQGPYPCDCCEGNHYIVACSRFRSLDSTARRKVATNNRLCFNCLGRHSASSCRSKLNCKHCGRHHHTMLHDDGYHGPIDQLKTHGQAQSAQLRPRSASQSSQQSRSSSQSPSRSATQSPAPETSKKQDEAQPSGSSAPH